MSLPAWLGSLLIGLALPAGCVAGRAPLHPVVLPSGDSTVRSQELGPAALEPLPPDPAEAKDASHQKIGFPPADPLGQGALTPGVLMPRKAADDAVVARIGGFPIRKSHIYDRMFEVDTLRTKTVVDTIAFDILLASQAKKHHIFLDPTMIDKIVKEEVDRMVAKVEKEWKGRISIDDYLQILRGRDLKTDRQFMRRQMARDLFRYYVVRYLALRENRVQVRILTHPDRREIETIRSMVGEGASFETFALKKSRHTSQRDGGKLPPFTREDKSEFSEAAFQLKEGEVSQVRQTTQDGAPMYFLLYCMHHMPGRDISFKQAKPELDRAWITTPLVRGEANMLYLRLRHASEALINGGQKR